MHPKSDEVLQMIPPCYKLQACSCFIETVICDLNGKVYCKVDHFRPFKEFFEIVERTETTNLRT